MANVGPRDPGETSEAYMRRVIAAAPSLTPELARRIARLLPMPHHGGGLGARD